MKKCIIILVCQLAYITNYSQSSTLKLDENSKSGNYKDILTSFYQLAIKDFSNEEKSIGFNSTLFALKLKSNPELLKDENYVKSTFSRNFQFNFKLDLNTDFKYKGFTGGITYAPINNRDKTLANFEGTKIDKIYSEFNNLLEYIISELNKEITDDKLILNKSLELNNLQIAVNEIKTIKKNSSNSTNAYVQKILKKLNPQIEKMGYSDENGVAIKNSESLLIYINNTTESYYKEIQSKGMLTLTTDGTANESGKFNKTSFGLTYLKGNKEGWNEIDLRAKFVYADTLETVHLPRTEFNTKLGWNFKFGNNFNNQSYLEIKAVAEYNKVFKNKLPDEEDEVYTGNAEFRIRITDELWIPFIVKYDIKNSNFLGFLNVTYNFGS